MMRRFSLDSRSVLHALLACAVLSTNGQATAQPHTVPEPDLRMIVRAEDQLDKEEQRGANPCFRNQFQMKDAEEYQRLAWLAFCVERPRARAVSQAWAKGLDAYGEKLPADARTRKLAEMELWLRNLTGKYRIEGRYGNSGGTSPVRGTADCFGIGSGPGMACAISAEWSAPKEVIKDRRLDQVLYNAMRGLVLLFGIDPGASQVRVTLMDFRAIGMSGFLDEGTVMFGGRLNFENLFATPLVTYTWQNAVVTTKPGGDLGMKFLVRTADILSSSTAIMFVLQLRREPAAVAAASSVVNNL
jgi:hypothetical protein